MGRRMPRYIWGRLPGLLMAELWRRVFWLLLLLWRMDGSGLVLGCRRL